MSVIFEKLTQVIAAGANWDIGIAGSYMRISAGQWPCTVMLLRQGRVIGQMANMLAGDYVEGVDFDGISIVNGSTAQVIDIQVCGGGAGSNRVIGEVSVINGELSRVKAGQCFIGFVNIAAIAGNYGHIEVWNPAASGKNIILNQMSVYGFSLPGLTGFRIQQHGSALTTLIGNAKSKKIGGAASVGELRTAYNAAFIGTKIAGSCPSVAGEAKEFLFSEPLVIPPNFGIIAAMNQVNVNFEASFQWIEEGI